ncbi:3-isopropylmalate dehydratase small subunit [Acuticoccus sediminis]|uniref:3-isopropylmalate dehydratase n=1 Tax=Acuticoccus sediminis TaxID=2184697 RepID=A0A8B2NSG7_9HYPH|nr:3-isopropylmalate dehydratase small subunit [Acuticoccus sediminis]RAI01861.1 3-isopropylmalate dehydratase small subunit [Acuticoccus sediminis]
MTPIRRLTGIAAPLRGDNVDTDQIFPARYMSRPRKPAGYGDVLLHDHRFDPAGRENPDFVLNRDPYRRATVLVGGANFACGSAREQAVHALLDYGIRAVLAADMGDIFASSALENGLIAVSVGAEAGAAILARLEDEPGLEIAIDLEARTIEVPGLPTIGIALSGRRRTMLMDGLDPLRQLAAMTDRIDAFEARLPAGSAAAPGARPGPDGR